MSKYKLINPQIDGSMDTTVKGRNSFSAAKKIYNNLSQYFTNHLDNFYITLQNLDTHELSNFKIQEKRKDNDNVNYDLIKLNDSFPSDLNDKIIDVVNSKQTGGKHKHKSSSSSSSSSSSDSYFDYPIQPITRFTYFYLPYYTIDVIGLSPLDQARLFFPNFNLPINPTIEVRFDLYKY